MTFSAFNSHTNQLFIDLKLVKVSDIIKLQQLKLVHGFYNKVLPTDIQHLFTFSRDIHTTNLQLNCIYKNLLYKPHIKTTTYGIKSIKYHCADLWNELFKKGISIDKNAKNAKNNVVIDQIHNVYHFKRTLKRDYLYSYSVE